ncbi:hypothetical protein LCGC14_0176080 [marine sediment metagenome]|uniref:Uncharacterized protein n=1 Tax=marine sediment metagenome TaxID=412755 RepID=A0A0F9UVH0_9ZZZZ
MVKKSSWLEKLNKIIFSKETYKKIGKIIVFYFALMVRPHFLWFKKQLKMGDKPMKPLRKIGHYFLWLLLFFTFTIYLYVVFIITALLILLITQILTIISMPILIVISVVIMYKFYKIMWMIGDKIDDQFIEMSVTYRKHKKKPRRLLK